jgi:hypothetical protein
MIASPLLPELPFGAKLTEWRIKHHGLITNGIINGIEFNWLDWTVQTDSHLYRATGSTDYLLTVGGAQAVFPAVEYELGVNAWLYSAPSGKVWWVKITDVEHPFGQPLVLNVTFSRFGAFGAAPETHTQTATLSDWGQDLNQPYFIAANYNWGTSSPETSAYVTFFSSLPDGSAATLAVDVRFLRLPFVDSISKYPQDVLTCSPHAIGWLTAACSENPITGVPSISLALLYDRAQTLGTRTQTIADNMVLKDFCGTLSIMSFYEGSISVTESIIGRVLSVFYYGGSRLEHRVDVTNDYDRSMTWKGGCPPSGGSPDVDLAEGDCTQTITYRVYEGSNEVTTTIVMASTSKYLSGGPPLFARSETDWSYTVNSGAKVWSGKTWDKYEGVITGLTLQDETLHTYPAGSLLPYNLDHYCLGDGVGHCILCRLVLNEDVMPFDPPNREEKYTTNSDCFLYRFNNHCIGAEVWHSGLAPEFPFEAVYWSRYAPDCLTPVGPYTLDFYHLDSNHAALTEYRFNSVAFNPATGQLAKQSSGPSVFGSIHWV